MAFPRAHVLATAVGAAALAAAAVLALARPAYRTAAAPGPPDRGLPYDVATYSAREARSAFAAEGVTLTLRSRAPAATTLGNRGDVLEVDVFGDRAQVEAAGFSDDTVWQGRRVRLARTCGSGVDAERWHANVRAIVDCSAAGGAAGAWLRRVDRALGRL